jgi:hypothetical protein
MVVDSDVDEFPACTLTAAIACAASGDAVAHAAETAEPLNIEMDDLACHPAVFATAPAIGIHHSHTLASNSSAHGIIHSSAGENNLWMISSSLCPVSQVIGINPNAVATHKAWGKVEKIPFGSGGSEHLRGIDYSPRGKLSKARS